MYCTNCGATITVSAQFCTACGASRSQAAATEPTAIAPPPAPFGGSPPPSPAYGFPPAYASRSGMSPGTKVAVVIVSVLVVVVAIGVVAFSFLAGGEQLGACVEEWQYQGTTRKENWTRAECQAFCDGPVNDGVHLACYFEPY